METPSKKIVLITGANRGIGYGIVEQFCLKSNVDDFEVILTSRSKDSGIQALEKLKGQYPNFGKALHYTQLDVGSEDSISTLTSYIKDTFGRISILYNNAGVLFRDPPQNDYEERLRQVEETFRVNVFSVINLTEALIPLIEEGGQIINVSSELGKMKDNKALIDRFYREDLSIGDLYKYYEEYRIAFAENNLEKTGWKDDFSVAYGCYGISKVFLNAYNQILDLRFKNQGKNIKANIVSPLWCSTDMGGKEAPRTYLEGALTPHFMASFPTDKNSRDEYSGKFWINEKICDFFSFI
jgi:NAD(P)-dependent dehydrogenase (short-subunit alcohol dehydrogenase family)